MGVGGAARHFIRISKEQDVPPAILWAQARSLPILILGGGSNMVVSDRGFDGLVMKIEIRGIEFTENPDSSVVVTVGAGEPWDAFVERSVEQGWWGVENMSLIPGATGAVPVQNVGAYGQESRDVVLRVRAYDTHRHEFVELDNAACGFGFRKSIFNGSAKDRYVIVSVVFRLCKNGQPELTRANVRAALAKRGPARPAASVSQGDMRAAIVHLRVHGGLLPPPDTLGNSGTFFRAGVLDRAELWRVVRTIRKNLGWTVAAKVYACRWKWASASGIKVPSKMLIQACRLGRVSSGGISLFPTNCAVLVNSGKASGAADILRMIRTVRTAVYEKTGVAVPVEPALVGFAQEELDAAFALPDQTGALRSGRCPS